MSGWDPASHLTPVGDENVLEAMDEKFLQIPDAWDNHLTLPHSELSRQNAGGGAAGRVWERGRLERSQAPRSAVVGHQSSSAFACTVVMLSLLSAMSYSSRSCTPFSSWSKPGLLDSAALPPASPTKEKR